MAEPFKNLLSAKVIAEMARHFKLHWNDFNEAGFVKDASKGLDLLELKARTDRITDVMIQYLPSDFVKAGDILISSLQAPLTDSSLTSTTDESGIAGWAIIPLTHYVAQQGHEHFDLSMNLFREMTKRATSEFGIRSFLIESSEQTLTTLNTWVNDESQHVRRLVSEGSRPRLPWAMSLSKFIQDPSPVIELLEKLKDDDEEYVRRSVANNLNDISKDHPELVADIAEEWMKGAGDERKRLIRHACRTLIKKGHKKTLSIFGFNTPKVHKLKIAIPTPTMVFGSPLQFELSLESSSDKDQALMIDYIIHHQKANGKTTPKVFKWRTVKLKPGEKLTLAKNHPIKKITTRVYHEGLHSIEILVNGEAMGKTGFHLLMP